MPVFRVEIKPRQTGSSYDPAVADVLREAGLPGLTSVDASRLFFLEGALDRPAVEAVASALLTDDVTELAQIAGEHDELTPPPTGALACEVHPKPGVMDPVALSTLTELQAEQVPVEAVRTGRRFVVHGAADAELLRRVVGRALANDCIEDVVIGTAGVRPAPHAPELPFELRSVPLRDLDDAALAQLSREGHLFLSLEEMRTIQAHYRDLGREPTDLELETLAQTWSEHCVHKTLKSAIEYRGAPLPSVGRPAEDADEVELRYDNLLRDTIARVTKELMDAGRGPECLSVFKDNAGVIGFDEDFGVAFKVETHNHPSAIEPYGGAATGAGGCIRDVMGCGLGARPIANTDVFCVAPGDWPLDNLPKGVLHPARVLRGIVAGVADYGNRMGIPTVNGAVHFDARYLGNPLVFCGCVGLMPRDKVEKAARPGDLVVVIGGRTGRDGIHGATFSSAELTDSHVDEFSHAVQIGNAITEKRCLDAMMRARDHAGGCLYTATTDCGAGGLSSAVGEMGAETGVDVELENVPLKYPGLRYDEIWISEAQERMVLAVPPDRLDALLQIMREEEVEATVIGTFGRTDPQTGRPELVVRYRGGEVGRLDMAFLHEGLPKTRRQATWQPIRPTPTSPPRTPTGATIEQLHAALGGPNVTSREWIIEQYDHEVQGGSVIKPLCGPGRGPGDAAVLRPRLDSPRGIALGCGLCPDVGDADPYWMAAAAIDEALRNVIAVGGDPARTAILDNFCWGRTDDPQQLGGLVRACQACYDVARVYGVPFISGKDSLNNEFALDAGDVERVVTMLSGTPDDAAAHGGPAPPWRAAVAERIRRTQRLSIPATLLISALSLIDDVRRCVTPDLKQPGRDLWLVGGQPAAGFDVDLAHRTHQAVAAAIAAGAVAACHDVSDGGWLVALAEMSIAGDRGVTVMEAALAASSPFVPLTAAYVIEPVDPDALERFVDDYRVGPLLLGRTRADDQFMLPDGSSEVRSLRRRWSGAS